MEANVIFPALIRWIHILSAITAIGGTIFLRLVLHPSAVATLEADQHQPLRERIAKRWRMVLHACIGLLIATGIYNLTRMLPVHKGQAMYHGVFGLKLILAMAIFFVAIALSGSNPAFAGMRKNAPKWMTLNIVLAVVLVLLSAILNNLPKMV